MEYIKEKLPIAIMILIAVAICGISYYCISSVIQFGVGEI